MKPWTPEEPDQQALLDHALDILGTQEDTKQRVYASWGIQFSIFHARYAEALMSKSAEGDWAPSRWGVSETRRRLTQIYEGLILVLEALDPELYAYCLDEELEPKHCVADRARGLLFPFKTPDGTFSGNDMFEILWQLAEKALQEAEMLPRGNDVVKDPGKNHLVRGLMGVYRLNRSKKPTENNNEFLEFLEIVYELWRGKAPGQVPGKGGQVELLSPFSSSIRRAQE